LDLPQDTLTIYILQREDVCLHWIRVDTFTQRKQSNIRNGSAKRKLKINFGKYSYSMLIMAISSNQYLDVELFFLIYVNFLIFKTVDLLIFFSPPADQSPDGSRHQVQRRENQTQSIRRCEGPKRTNARESLDRS